MAWPRTHSAMEPRSVGFQVEGFHVLTFLSLSSPLCKDSRTSRPSLDSWGNRSSHPVVCSRVWLGTKNFCLRTLRACSPQPLETHWEPFTSLQRPGLLLVVEIAATETFQVRGDHGVDGSPGSLVWGLQEEGMQTKMLTVRAGTRGSREPTDVEKETQGPLPGPIDSSTQACLAKAGGAGTP